MISFAIQMLNASSEILREDRSASVDQVLLEMALSASLGKRMIAVSLTTAIQEQNVFTMTKIEEMNVVADQDLQVTYTFVHLFINNLSLSQ